MGKGRFERILPKLCETATKTKKAVSLHWKTTSIDGKRGLEGTFPFAGITLIRFKGFPSGFSVAMDTPNELIISYALINEKSSPRF
jgi:hypothetical protein